MKLDETQLASVVFLCVNEQGDDGVVRPQPRATGFFIALRTADEKGLLPYVVTARHCVEEASDPLYIRVNRAAAGEGFEDIPTSGNDWFTHDSADVAVIPFMADPNRNTLRVNLLPEEQFVDPDYRYWARQSAFEQPANELGGFPVEIGQEVAFLGLFIQHAGRNRNLPIARFGAISRMPSEPIAVKRPSGQRERLLAYLIECRSWGGHSGSPVFWCAPNLDPPVSA